MGGLVRVITQTANMNDFSVNGDLQGYGMSHATEPGGEASVVTNIPLVQDLAAVRVSAFSSYQPGYFKRTYDDPAALNVTGNPVAGPAKVVDNVGASTQEGVAASFRVTPIDDLVLTPSFRWQKTEGNGFPLADYDPDNLTPTPDLQSGGIVRRRVLFRRLHRSLYCVVWAFRFVNKLVDPQFL